MVRILQISDTHLSPHKQHFAANWQPLREWVIEQKAELVIHTGDLTVDGADSEEDMREGAKLMRSLGRPLLAVPGNHDVGEAGNRHQPVDANRLDRWRRHFGADWWSHDVAGWRLVGLDSMLFGSGSEDETRQLQWLDETLASSDGRRIAWFTHRPLFIHSPDEGDTGYWSVKPGPRMRLLERIDRYGVALVATGHLHKWNQQQSGACRYVWCPSSAFLVGSDNQAEMPGEKFLGAVIYELDDAQLSIVPVAVPGLTQLWIDDVLQEVYPPRHAA